MKKFFSNIEELRLTCQKKIPKMFYDYVDSGSWNEITYKNNQADFAKYSFLQKVGISINQINTKSFFLGKEYSLPIAIAPTGLMGMVWPDGEIIAAKVAKKFNIPFCLSTMSICSIEDVANSSPQDFWFQLYVMKDRGFVKNLIERAKNAKCSALVLTMDLQVLGQRHKDIKNGLSIPPKISIKNILNIASKIKWCQAILKSPHRTFGNIVGHHPKVCDMTSLSYWISQQFDPTLCWQDVEWIKNNWGGKLIIKGLMNQDDMVTAFNCGADAVIISNHGGRQLDSTISAIQALEKISVQLKKDNEIYFDSGIRSGQDVLKALALGAKNTFIGRAFLYGLGANGEQGAIAAIEIIKKELETTMALIGVDDIKKIDNRILCC